MSNLLEKASILLTPTAYSDGSLNTVIPPYAPSYINNIPFVTSEWGSLVEGWSIDETNNKLVAEATWTGLHKRAQYIIPEIQVGKTVKFSFDAVVTAGKFHFLSPFSSGDVGYASPDFINQSGSYSFTFVASSSSVYFRNKSTDFAGEITNIRVEVIEEADFDFSRGSSATRVNEKGLIEDVTKLGSELVTNGNFDTDSDWALRFVVIEDGVAKFQENGGTYTRARQNTGFIGQAKVTYTISFNNTSNTTILLRSYFGGDTTNVPATVGTHTIYINFTSSAVSFQASNIAAGEEIHLDNVSVKEVIDSTDIPRIDYTSGQGALLLEPQSTNLLPYSEDFTQWTKLADGTGVAPVITTNNAVSPDGTQNADKIVFSRTSTGGSDYTLIKKDYGGSDINGTASIYLKSDTNVDIEITSDDINYTTVTVTTNWKRFEVSDATSDRLTFGLRGPEPSTLNATVYAWGAQLEAGSYATSYIPTEGSTVTRSADVANNSGNADLFNDSEGVLYAEISGFVNGSGGDRTISISDGSTQNTLQLLLHNTANRINFRLRSGGSLDVNISDFTFEQNEINKIACKYKSGDYALWINGEEKATSTSSSLPSGLSELAFNDGAFNDFYGNVKSVAVFKEALTDFELACLTS